MPGTFDASLFEYSLLGSVVVSYGERRVPLPPGGNAEKIIAILLTRDGEYVTARELSELLGTSERVVHTAVYRLHERFESLGLELPVNKRDRQGYRLEFKPHHLDANRFQDLVVAAQEAAAQGDPEAALKYLDETLSLWRGDEFIAGHDSTAIARSMTVDLTRLRERARLLWCDITLDLNQPWDALPTAERLVDQDPLSQPAAERLVRSQIPTLGPYKAQQTCKDYCDRLEAAYAGKPTASFRRLQEEIRRQLE